MARRRGNSEQRSPGPRGSEQRSPGRRRSEQRSLAAAVLLLAACGAPHPPDPWTLWTIDTLALRGDPAVTPAGATLRFLSSPFAAGSAVQEAGQSGLTIFPAFSEGQTAAYMTTEIWQNFDQVWIQPLYIPVGGPPGSLPIFGVDATTRFYSPFWQIFTFTPPDGQIFKSAKEVLDSGAALTPGPAKFCAITQDASIVDAIAAGATGPVRPITLEPVGLARNSVAFADGRVVWFVDLGLNRFTWDPQSGVVHESALFAFARSDADGNTVELDLPKVGGSGELHQGVCDGKGNCAGVSASGVPPFGSLWRIYDVLLPAAADVYVPSSMPELQATVQAMGFAAAVPDSALPPGAQPAAYALRVRLGGAWLDSQTAIEAGIPDWRLTETGTDVACPLVLFNGKAIGP